MNSGQRTSTETPLNTNLEALNFARAELQANPLAARSSSSPVLGPVVVPVDPSAQPVDEVVFIDRALPDFQGLVADIRRNRPNVPIVELDPAQDGITQITNALTTRFRVRKQVHIVSPGNQGLAKIGSVQLTDRSVNNYSNSFRRWNDALDSGAAILFYGSNIGAGNGGQLLRQISQLTGASVLASTDATGSRALRGDWDLERRVLAVDTKAIAAQIIFSSSLQNSYGAVFTFSG